MAKCSRWLSLFFFFAALVGIAVLLLFDAVNRLASTSIHQQAGAMSLILIGASYISLQCSSARPWGEWTKGVLLGVAFILWGGEVFVPSGWVVTMMDSTVVTIFVVDLGLIILEHLRRRDHETP